MSTDASPIRALIVDDEPLARERLHELLDDTPSVTVVGDAEDGPEAVDAIREQLVESFAGQRLVVHDERVNGRGVGGHGEENGGARRGSVGLRGGNWGSERRGARGRVEGRAGVVWNPKHGPGASSLTAPVPAPEAD